MRGRTPRPGQQAAEQLEKTVGVYHAGTHAALELSRMPQGVRFRPEQGHSRHPMMRKFNDVVGCAPPIWRTPQPALMRNVPVGVPGDPAAAKSE